MIFPGFPGVLSFSQVFQVFQVEWEPCDNSLTTSFAEVFLIVNRSIGYL